MAMNVCTIGKIQPSCSKKKSWKGLGAPSRGAEEYSRSGGGGDEESILRTKEEKKYDSLGGTK